MASSAGRSRLNERVVERDHQRCILPMTVKVLKFRHAENRSVFRPATMLSWVGAAGMLGLQCGGDAGRYDQADDRGDRPGAASGGSVGAVPGGSSACRVKFKMLSSFQDDQQNRGFFNSLISRK